ncbi:MAG: SPOR domain-containing protein [Candidatus Sulfotelmatobacter sp.]
MEPSQDTEITLGTAKLLGLFFGLVIVCAVFFALGYTLGRKSDAGLTTASAAAPLQTFNGPKPAVSGSPAQPAPPPMTFYKAVEQKDGDAQLTPASTEAAPANSTAGQPAAAAPGAASSSAASPEGQGQPSQTSSPPDPMAAIPMGGYFVQVAAVSKQEDADALVDALKKKQYPALVATNSATDKLFRVQIGPFADIKDAEATRSRLINDGYNPILKK